MEEEIQTEQPKNKRGLILWIILILVLGAVLFLVLINCTVKNMLGLGLSCHLDKAITENNVSICNKLSRNNQVSTCYKEYAIVKKDTSVCENIPDKLEIMTCYRGIAQISENKITLCNSLAEESVGRSNCYSAFVDIKNNIAECDLLSGIDKDICYRFFATIKNAFQWCSSIINVNEKSTCERDSFLSTVSKDTPCADSDSGVNQKVKGIVIDNNKNAVYEDQCLSTSLIEHYCENNRHQQKEIPCGCNDGVCP